MKHLYGNQFVVAESIAEATCMDIRAATVTLKPFWPPCLASLPLRADMMHDNKNG